MNTISLAGLTGTPAEVRCAVNVLGDPRLSDPTSDHSLAELERLSAVSPNGQWLGLTRQGFSKGHSLLIIAPVQEGAEEIIVPLDMEWEWPRIRAITDDGTLLFRVELARRDHGYARRPLLFKPGDKEPLILPPPYTKPEWSRRPNDPAPLSHTPYCFAPDGTIFGWTHPRREERRQRAVETIDIGHCVWRQLPTGWMVEYLPDFLNDKWLWPACNGTFLWANAPRKDATICFGVFDGVSCTPCEVTLDGSGPKVFGAATNGTFIGSYSIHDGRHGVDDEGKPDLSCYTYLLRPHHNTIRVFNEAADKNPWLEHLSANGQYVVGSQAGVGYFILKAMGGGYRYAVLHAPGWRIESLACVTDEGKVFATATCVERKHGCFRLTLPVLLTPRW
jgi:hypothetical protein